MEEIKGLLKIDDECSCWEYCSSQLYKNSYQIPIKKGESIELKDHLWSNDFTIMDILSNDEIVIRVGNLPETSVKRGETKTFEDSDSCGEGEHFEAYHFSLTVSFVDE